MLNPGDIKGRNFEVQKNGYNPVDVDSFLSEISSEYAELKRKNEENEEKLKAYESDASAISDALVVAQREANKILNDAKTKARDMVENAKTEQVRLAEQSASECERIVNEHKEKCAQLIKENTEETERKIQAVKDAYNEEKIAYEQLREEVTYFKAGLIDLYNKQIKLIMEMPELSDEELEKIENGSLNDDIEEAEEENAVQETDVTDDNSDNDAENEEASSSVNQVDEIFNTGSIDPVIPKESLNDLRFGKNN